MTECNAFANIDSEYLPLPTTAAFPVVIDNHRDELQIETWNVILLLYCNTFFRPIFIAYCKLQFPT